MLAVGDHVVDKQREHRIFPVKTHRPKTAGGVLQNDGWDRRDSSRRAPFQDRLRHSRNSSFPRDRLYASPDADDVAFREAMEQAVGNEFAEDLPDGYDTIVGDRGVRLSDGQRQRVTDTRELVRNPRSQVFDEGTSYVDNGTMSGRADSMRTRSSCRCRPIRRRRRGSRFQTGTSAVFPLRRRIRWRCAGHLGLSA